MMTAVEPRLPFQESVMPLMPDLRAVILAGGEGSRLAPLTRGLYGFPLPKQFAALLGERSLLQQTLARTARVFDPDKTLVVAPLAHAEIARAQVAAFEGVDLLLQPANLGTGPGLLLPLAVLRERCPSSVLAVFPSDHHVANPQPLLEAVTQAAIDALDGSFDLALLGIEPDRDEGDLGWILPGPRQDGVARVSQFLEKPPLERARRLRASGGLWNSFIMIGRVERLWQLGRKHLPLAALLLERHVRRDPDLQDAEGLAALYRRMPRGDWSRDVLERAERLAVYPVAGSGWSDWGTPERVLESLDPRNREELLFRLSGGFGLAPVS